MPNQVQSWVVRTLVPLLVGLIVAYAVKIGFHLDSASVTVWVTTVITAAYAALARYIEVKWPGVGKYFVSLGLVTAQPTYVTASVPAPPGPRAAVHPASEAAPVVSDFPADKPHDLA